MPVGSVSEMASAITAICAVLALAGIWIQIRASAQLQQEAAARALYAGFLNTVAKEPGTMEMPKNLQGSRYDWVIYQWLLALESGWFSSQERGVWGRAIDSCVRQQTGYFKTDYWKNTGQWKGSGVSLDFDSRFVRRITEALARTEAV